MPDAPSLRLGLLASHGGSNLQAIIDACANGLLDATCAVVISNNSTAKALDRARAADIAAFHLSTKTHGELLDQAITDALTSYSVDVVCLAGYMKKLGPITLERFAGRIINIHPALLPRYGGKGMYGEKVHEAVLASGDRESGATVHVVDENYDTGNLLAQSVVPVFDNDNVETLAKRVLKVEHELYVSTLRQIANGEISLG